MCQACATRHRRRSELDEALRLVEQALSRIGWIRPGHGRAKGGAPRELVRSLAADLDRLWEELAGEIRASLREHQGKTAFDEQAIEAALIGFQSSFRSLLTQAVSEAVRAGAEAAAEEAGGTVSFGGIDAGVLTALQSQAINLCEATAAKIKGDVQGQLIESVRLGENLTQTIARLQGISSLSAYDCERIARTELARAANAGRLTGYKGRVSHVVWVLGATYSGGCECGEMAGTYTLEEAAGLSMPLHPNCDCYWRPATEEEVADYEAAA